MQALKGVSLAVARRRADAADGAVGQRQDHAALHSRLHADADERHGAGAAAQPIAGAEPEELAKLRREHIGFVFQSYHLFPTLTALDNVRLALDVRGENSHRAMQKAKEALATVGLALKMSSYPRELSGGEQQRVAIARAIVGNASVILADEPTAALDSENGHAIMAVLAEIARDRGRGVLVVTHDPRIVPFADRIVRIEDGKIIGEERASDRKAGRREQRQATAEAKVLSTMVALKRNRIVVVAFALIGLAAALAPSLDDDARAQEALRPQDVAGGGARPRRAMVGRDQDRIGRHGPRRRGPGEGQRHGLCRRSADPPRRRRGAQPPRQGRAASTTCASARARRPTAKTAERRKLEDAVGDGETRGGRGARRARPRRGGETRRRRLRRRPRRRPQGARQRARAVARAARRARQVRGRRADRRADRPRRPVRDGAASTCAAPKPRSTT